MASTRLLPKNYNISTHACFHDKGAPFGLILLFMALASSAMVAFAIRDHFNVVDYGATSDGQTDDSQAFVEAWEAACRAKIDSPRIYIPANNNFLVTPITFHGPCVASTIIFMISGTIIAPESPSSWNGRDASQWLRFENINGLKIDGSGLVDGRGKAWWDQSCRYHPELSYCTKLAPTILKFMHCNEGGVSNMKLINSPQTHILLSGCDGFNIANVIIDSPANSPNTDGIHIQSSLHIFITNSKIGSGDDCISVGDYTSNIEIHNIVCGPGHGISIGSLGKSGNYVQVQNIRIIDSIFNGTSNGARIKTWQVGRGYVRDLTFENLLFHLVRNPIIIDQNYCSIRNACKQEETGVEIRNVIYKQIGGTSATDFAINLNCSEFVPCFGISMESIHIQSAKVGKQITANCSNAYGQEVDVVPGPCLTQY